MVLYEVSLSMTLLGFGMGTMVANFHTREECESKKTYMCFRYLMFSLSELDL